METSLVEQQKEIPSLIDQAIDIGNVSQIVELKKRHDELSLQLIANRMAKIKSEIKSKKKEQIENESALKINTLKRQRVGIELDEALQVAQKIGDEYSKLEFEAGISDNKKRILEDSIRDLQSELEDLTNQLRDGTSNGKSKLRGTQE